jgi:hypothetical protein
MAVLDNFKGITSIKNSLISDYQYYTPIKMPMNILSYTIIIVNSHYRICVLHNINYSIYIYKPLQKSPIISTFTFVTMQM